MKWFKKIRAQGLSLLFLSAIVSACKGEWNADSVGVSGVSATSSELSGPTRPVVVDVDPNSLKDNIRGFWVLNQITCGGTVIDFDDDQKFNPVLEIGVLGGGFVMPGPENTRIECNSDQRFKFEYKDDEKDFIKLIRSGNQSFNTDDCPEDVEKFLSPLELRQYYLDSGAFRFQISEEEGLKLVSDEEVPCAGTDELTKVEISFYRQAQTHTDGVSFSKNVKTEAPIVQKSVQPAVPVSKPATSVTKAAASSAVPSPLPRVVAPSPAPQAAVPGQVEEVQKPEKSFFQKVKHAIIYVLHKIGAQKILHVLSPKHSQKTSAVKSSHSKPSSTVDQ